VLASTKENDLVLDPFTGSGTVGVVAVKHGRNFVGIELNEDYVQIARQRISVALSQVNESNNG
jgi:DNA modification methylase